MSYSRPDFVGNVGVFLVLLKLPLTVRSDRSEELWLLCTECGGRDTHLCIFVFCFQSLKFHYRDFLARHQCLWHDTGLTGEATGGIVHRVGLT